MRIATYNIYDCIGRDGRFDPARIATVLTELDADLIALQEVTLDSAGDLVGRFEQATGLQGIDGTLFERGVGRYGNLILTRHRVLETRLHDISAVGREQRGVIEALLDVDGTALKVFAMHLGLKGVERRSQIRHLATLVDDATPAALLMGDFNIWGLPVLLRQLSSADFRHTAVRSFPTWPWPLFAIDRLLARPPEVVSQCRRYDSPLAHIASDHFPIVAELTISQ